MARHPKKEIEEVIEYARRKGCCKRLGRERIVTACYTVQGKHETGAGFLCIQRLEVSKIMHGISAVKSTDARIALMNHEDF